MRQFCIKLQVLGNVLVDFKITAPEIVPYAEPRIIYVPTPMPPPIDRRWKTRREDGDSRVLVGGEVDSNQETLEAA